MLPYAGPNNRTMNSTFSTLGKETKRIGLVEQDEISPVVKHTSSHLRLGTNVTCDRRNFEIMDNCFYLGTRRP